ncbi:anti-CBASS protein Acb1 family protein [Roseibium alexandrii]|uniref:anti-CBASS protein Acb1 family protein n=1 Tax=Roseibium alexandrii TaxID=388408 RepID=UPI003752E6A8
MGKMFSFDGLRSLVSGLGTPGRDKAATTEYSYIPLSDDQLFAAFKTSWVINKMIRVPAQDATRKWRHWQADQKQIEAIEAEEKRLGIQNKLRQCKTWARLWGGAAIYIGTDQDPSEPFDPASIGKDGIQYLTVMTRKELSAGELERDPRSELYGKPKDYQIAGVTDFQKVHPSRLIILIGEEHPDPFQVPGVNAGWGESAVQSAYDACKNADSTAGNIASLVFEANIDVFGVPDLMSQLADPAYEERVLKRFSLASLGKGINKTLIHDAAEEFNRKQINFSQLPELLQQFLLMVSGASDIPLTRFLGQSPAGLSSTGDGDMNNYFEMVHALQTLDLEPALKRFDDALISSALGSRPDEIWYEWAPLKQMSEKEIAEIGERTAKTLEAMSRVGGWTGEELREVGTNQFVENGVFPGLDNVVAETDASGGFDLGEGDDGDDQDTNASTQAQDAAPRTLYVSRKVVNAVEIMEWAKAQGFKSTLSPEDLHVTIAFSRQPVDWMSIGEAWQSELTIAEGGPRLMEVFGGGALVLQFKSSELEWRHEHMREMGASWDWPEYLPHISISYQGEDIDLANVQPYQGKIVLGPEIFEEVNEDWKSSIKEQDKAQ